MANQPLEPGQHYHIYNRGNNRENLFIETRNYPYFLELYSKYIQPIAKTYAYCLLPNHFHFFICTRTEEEQETYHRDQIDSISGNSGDQIGLVSKIEPIYKPKPPSRAFNNMFIAYARAFNKTFQRTGKLFQMPFGRKPVDNEAYFLTLVAYIHRNPQKHGLVRDFRQWKWSSYATYLSNKPTKIERELVLAWSGGLSGFSELHETAVDESKISPLLGIY